MQFADPKSNIAFKKIFVDPHHPEALLEFLNAVLEPPYPITHVTAIDPYQAPRLREMKETMLDVQAQDNAGRHFIIEMQVEEHQAFTQRVLYYSSKAYASQLHVREAYSTLKPVLFLGILNFSMFQGEQPVTRHLILNPDNQAHELQDVAFNFIELPKFNKTLDALRTPLDQWLYFLKHAPDMDRIPDTVRTAGLRTAYEVSNQHTWTAREMRVYDYWSMQDRIHLDALRTAHHKGEAKGAAAGRQRGFQQGIEQGMAQGSIAEALAIAQRMMGMHLPMDTIVQATGMSAEAIASLHTT